MCRALSDRETARRRRRSARGRIARAVGVAGVALTASGQNIVLAQTGPSGRATTGPQLRPIAAIIAYPGFSPHATLATETHQSYPIPVRAPTGLQVVFFFCASTLQPGVGMWLTPPEREARVDAATGRLVALRPIRPQDFGQAAPPNGTIGTYNMLRAVPSEEWNATQERLLRAYDTLLPLYAASERPRTAEQTAAATAFRDIFPRITEQGLLPYYRAVGREFFAWLDAPASR